MSDLKDALFSELNRPKREEGEYTIDELEASLKERGVDISHSMVERAVKEWVENGYASKRRAVVMLPNGQKRFMTVYKKTENAPKE